MLIISCLISANVQVQSQIPDPDQGLRAEWMRGTYGLNWKPAKSANGRSELETLTIKPFLEQISGLKSVDYIQLHLGESFIYSPVTWDRMTCWKAFGRETEMLTGIPLTWLFPGHPLAGIHSWTLFKTSEMQD